MPTWNPHNTSADHGVPVTRGRVHSVLSPLHPDTITHRTCRRGTPKRRFMAMPHPLRRRFSSSRFACALFAIACAVLVSPGAALETDQFLVWDLELADAAPAVNRYFNQQIREFLDRQNARQDPIDSPQELTNKLFFYLFNGLHSSRLRAWLHSSPEIDVYPPRDVKYAEHLRMSIYDMRSFPYILPLSRTMRVGDVYLGTDKFGHMFGFGRRSFKRYLRDREEGIPEEEAVRRTIMHGYFMERYLVGNVMDGIFSYADLEANYQGMMMARAFCEGDDAYFKRVDGKWVMTRPFDIRPFITPDFDESYNRSRYMGLRKFNVLRVLRAEICPKLSSPTVRARFARYRQWPPSRCRQVIDAYYRERGEDPRAEQDLETLCSPASPSVTSAAHGRAKPPGA